MTSCCDDFNNCTRGKDCPCRPAMYVVDQPPMPASLARQANERIRRLEAEKRFEIGYAHLLTISDAPGNWWDRLKWYQRLGVVCGVIWAVGLLVVTR